MSYHFWGIFNSTEYVSRKLHGSLGCTFSFCAVLLKTLLLVVETGSLAQGHILTGVYCEMAV